MNNPSDQPGAQAPAPPADDVAWLHTLLFPDGSQLLDYGDGIMLVETPPSYGDKKGGDVTDTVIT